MASISTPRARKRSGDATPNTSANSTRARRPHPSQLPSPVAGRSHGSNPRSPHLVSRKGKSPSDRSSMPASRSAETRPRSSPFTPRRKPSAPQRKARPFPASSSSTAVAAPPFPTGSGSGRSAATPPSRWTCRDTGRLLRSMTKRVARSPTPDTTPPPASVLRKAGSTKGTGRNSTASAARSRMTGPTTPSPM